MRAIAAACLCSILMSGCAASGPRELPTYVVRPQDTLYSIAWRHNLDYRDLARWNHVGADYRLTVGQVLLLEGGHATPPPAGSSARSSPAATATPSAPTAPAPAPSGQQQPAVNGSRSPSGAAPRARAAASPVAKAAPPGGTAAPATPPPATAQASEHGTKTPVAGAGGGKWVWPTERGAAPRPVPGGGVLLFGRLGQDVRAAATGRVVYVGNGIRGYGNLVILKHGEMFLSSYAHNREILVKEGQDVSIGQTIAHMGTGPHQTAVLYFEIRANGKPVDPLAYLPK
jgi:lipoprotein NlpD